MTNLSFHECEAGSQKTLAAACDGPMEYKSEKERGFFIKLTRVII